MKKGLRILYLGLILLVVTVNIRPHSTGAVTTADWKAGNIIDDSLFTDKNAMSVSQIQSWLDARLKNCDYWGTQISELGGPDYNGDGKVTRAEYGKSKNNPAPFTCINKYYEVPKTSPSSTVPKSNYGTSTIPSGAKSAAQLIYDAAQAYSISPKVLLVKLGTESAGPLTSDTWPFKRQYLYAMGAHCPDSGPGGSANCDVDYSGFSIQMREAAKLLRWYMDSMDESWWTYKKPYQTNNILWNVVETGCGGANVYIQNKATAALYTYTPYQPNSAALKNMYGTGDRCSAYGNRNFWRVYNDWFGSTTIPRIFRSSDSTKTYLLSGNDYYYIPSSDLLRAYGHTTTDAKVVAKSAIDQLTYKGILKPVARFGGDEIYLIDNGKRMHFTSPSMLNRYGYAIGDEVSLNSSIQYELESGGVVSEVASRIEDNKKFYVELGAKHHISGPTAYTTLGNPVYSSYKTTALSRYYISTLKPGSPILPKNSFAKDSDSSIRGFWDGTTLTTINTSVFDSLAPTVYSSTDVALLPTTSTNIPGLVKNKTSYYIIDTHAVYRLSASDIAFIGKLDSDFQTINDDLVYSLGGFMKPFSPITRVNNSNSLFLLKKGHRYYIPSRAVISDWGYAIGDAISINTHTSGSFPRANGTLMPIGSLVRINGGSRVYVINTLQSKLYIPSPDILKSYGFSFNSVRDIDALPEDIYPITGDLKNIITTQDTADSWVIDRGGSKRFIPNTLAGTENYDISAIKPSILNKNIVTYFTKRSTMTSLMQAEGTSPVYLIQSGEKHWLRTKNALTSRGYNYSDISIVSRSTLDTIPRGADYY